MSLIASASCFHCHHPALFPRAPSWPIISEESSDPLLPPSLPLLSLFCSLSGFAVLRSSELVPLLLLPLLPRPPKLPPGQLSPPRLPMLRLLSLSAAVIDLPALKVLLLSGLLHVIDPLPLSSSSPDPNSQLDRPMLNIASSMILNISSADFCSSLEPPTSPTPLWSEGVAARAASPSTGVPRQTLPKTPDHDGRFVMMKQHKKCATSAQRPRNTHVQNCNLGTQKKEFATTKDEFAITRDSLVIKQMNLQLQKMNLQLQKMNLQLEKMNLQLQKMNLQLQKMNSSEKT